MHLHRMRLEHFGAYRDTGWLNFSRGINLIVGQNNSGKSSLIKSLANSLPEKPHVSIEAWRREDLARPKQHIEISVSGQEIRRALLLRGGSLFWPLAVALRDVSDQAIDQAIFEGQQYVLAYTRSPGAYTRVDGRPLHGAYQGAGAAHIELIADTPRIRAGGHGMGERDTLIDIVPNLWNNVFTFDAERIGIGECGQQDTDRLTPRADNLPAFLHIMRGRRPLLFDRLVGHVRTVLPTVYSITTTPIGQSNTRILVWPTENMAEEAFSFPLAESGTGVGQVIAILAAAMTSDPTIFIIDEINSYLHPTAVKAMLRLLQTSYGHHQYIISTHSPEVISGGGTGAVLLVKREGMESVVQPVDMDDVGHLREMADNLGISVSDVFAADHVLWVEGRTEELCFSLLRDHFDLELPANTVISPVVATGDFFAQKRDIDLVFRVYQKLSQVSLPLVRSVAFSFDREGLTNNDIEDTHRRAKGRVGFLPRRHLECYFVVASAIAAFVNKSDTERAQPIANAQVESALIAKAGDAKYLAAADWSGDLADDKWLTNVDAANLIADTIAELTERRVQFVKGEESAQLLAFIIRENSTPIIGLIEYLQGIGKLLKEENLIL